MTESITPSPIQEPVSVDDNAGSLTVDLNQAGDGNAVDVLTIAAGDNNIGNVDVVSSALPTGAATLAEQQTQTTALQLIDDTVATDGAATPTKGILLAGQDGTNAQTVKTDAAGELQIDILSIAAGDTNIGNVDVVTMPTTTVTATDLDVRNLDIAQDDVAVAGMVAHDTAHGGSNPIIGGATHETIATSAPTNRLASVTDGDVTRLSATDGALFVIPTGPQTWDYHENSSSALTDTTVEAAPGAGLSLYVTDIVVSTGAATAFNIFFEEGASTVLGPWYLEAVAGRGFSIHFGTPKKITANTALTVTTSAAIAHSIDVTGFVAPG